ncbi:MAG: carbohydrate kinase family protein [Pseudomonadota bacterium]
MRSLHVGSAMIDIISIIEAENIERMTFSNDTRAFLMLEAGRKVPAQSITTHVGGGACNTAVALARRGWDAGVIVRVGRDLNAGAVREHLDREAVSRDWLVETDQAATGTAVMVASHDRNASIFVHRGANEGIGMECLPDAAFAGRDLVYIAALSSHSADAFGTIAAKGRAAGAMVAANPGIRQLTLRTEAVLQALGDIDLISINRVEAEALVPVMAARTSGAIASAIADAPDEAPALWSQGLTGGGVHLGLMRFLDGMRAAGPRYVVITDGTEGAWLAGPEGVIWHPSLPAKVAGTAGAGDAYCATLTAALAEGAAPARAMHEAAINAASVVSVVDTTAGLLDRAEIDRRASAPSQAMLFQAA